jgi:uracil-DNA glycosylase
MLDWLIAMGADETVGEAACNRFEMVPPVAAKKSAAAPRSIPSLEHAKPNPPSAQTGEEWGGLVPQSAVESKDVAELTAAFAAFEGCALKKSAMNFCFIGGNLAARILVLGDRPRTSEDKEGLSFAGKNAALLEAMLRAIGLSISEDVMLANFVPWRPPGNRPVTETEAKACIPFLERLLQIVQPVAVLMLGGLPGQWLAGGDQSIAKQRGKWMEIAGMPVIATFHPDDLMRTQTLKKLAWGDLKMFRDKLSERLGAT